MCIKSIIKSIHFPNQPLHSNHLPCTNPISKSSPDHSRPKPNWTDSIYAIKMPYRGIQKGDTSCSVFLVLHHAVKHNIYLTGFNSIESLFLLIKTVLFRNLESCLVCLFIIMYCKYAKSL